MDKRELPRIESRSEGDELGVDNKSKRKRNRRKKRKRIKDKERKLNIIGINVAGLMSKFEKIING